MCSTAEAEENEARRAARHNALDALLGLPGTDGITLAGQLQTLGRAESKSLAALDAAAKELNAQNVKARFNDEDPERGYWVMTCDPQPQDCGPLPTRDAG